MGRIRSVDRVLTSYGRHNFVSKKGRILKCGMVGRYLVHGLSKDGIQLNYSVHRLVMLAFVGPRPEGLEICHGDGNPENNALSNLRYDTKVGNAADKVLHKTNNLGETNPRAILTNEDVLEIFRRCEAGANQLELATSLEISPITVNHIATGRTWSSVTGKKWGRAAVVITPEIVRGIEKLQSEGKTLDQIASILGISKPSAFRHSKGKSKVLEWEALCS